MAALHLLGTTALTPPIAMESMRQALRLPHGPINATGLWGAHRVLPTSYI